MTINWGFHRATNGPRVLRYFPHVAQSSTTGMRRVLTIRIRSTAQIFSLNSWQQRGKIGCSAGCLLPTERTTDEELKIYSMLSPQRLSYIMMFSKAPLAFPPKKLTRFSKRSFTISFVYQVREQPPGWFPCEVPVRRYF